MSGDSGTAPSGASGNVHAITGGAVHRIDGVPGVDDPSAAAEPVTAAAVRATSFFERAVLRRRLSFLVRRRELALHDLGGFVFESHRVGSREPDVESRKLAALAAIDAEVATLQDALGRREELTVLREPGISSCPQCRTIHDSTARFCPGCGRPTAVGAP